LLELPVVLFEGVDCLVPGSELLREPLLFLLDFLFQLLVPIGVELFIDVDVVLQLFDEDVRSFNQTLEQELAEDHLVVLEVRSLVQQQFLELHDLFVVLLEGLKPVRLQLFVDAVVLLVYELQTALLLLVRLRSKAPRFLCIFPLSGP